MEQTASFYTRRRNSRLHRNAAVYHRRDKICNTISWVVRNSDRGLPGLIRSRRVSDQQIAWTATRTPMKMRNDESLVMVKGCRNFDEGDDRRKSIKRTKSAFSSMHLDDELPHGLIGMMSRKMQSGLYDTRVRGEPPQTRSMIDFFISLY